MAETVWGLGLLILEEILTRACSHYYLHVDISCYLLYALYSAHFYFPHPQPQPTPALALSGASQSVGVWTMLLRGPVTSIP